MFRSTQPSRSTQLLRRSSLFAASALIAVPTTVLGAAIPAVAAPVTAPPPSTTQTATFDCTGVANYFDVPPGVTQLTVRAAGAAGAGSGSGNGATVDATVSVTPYHLLRINVGCQNGYGYANGGAGGVHDQFAQDGTNGGGATGIVDTTSNTLLLVAGGGGGAGGTGAVTWDFGGNGGNGGSSAGSDGIGGSSGGGGGLANAPGPAGTAGSDGANDGGGGGGGGGGYPHGGSGGQGGGHLPLNGTRVGGGGGGGGGGGSNYWSSTATTDQTAGVAGSAADGTVTITLPGQVATPQQSQCASKYTTYTVPDNVYRLHVTAIGAAGGSSPYGSGGVGGAGTGLSADVAVKPGQTLTYAVGCAGQRGGKDGVSVWAPGGAGGFGYTNGGDGAPSNQPALVGQAYGACGGGGSTGFENSSVGEQLIAAGGGGCGGSGGEFGANKGGNGGDADLDNATSGSGLEAGGPGGVGGSTLGNVDSPGGPGVVPTDGYLGGGGGGGGGGYPYGGGGGEPGRVGGGGGGGGGGGESFEASSVTNVQFLSLSHYAGPNGLLAITPVFTQPQDLTVTTTASPTFTRTFGWGITKNVDQTKQTVGSGASATFKYTVDVSHNDGTDSNWAVSGTTTVHNSNPTAVSGVTLTATTNNGGTCTVSSGTGVTVPADGTITRSYTCTYQSKPDPGTGTVKGVAAWTSYGSPDTSSSDSATADFTTATPTRRDASVKVTDSDKGTLGTVTADDSSPKAFAYSLVFAGVSGTCTAYPNTATYTTDDSAKTGSAGQTVTVCKAATITASGQPLTGTEGAALKGVPVATFTTDASSSVVDSTFQASIDWGDGTTTTGTITAGKTGYTVSGTHTYREEGTYATKVTITDGQHDTASTGDRATIADAPLTGTGGQTFTATEGLAAPAQTVATFTDANPYGTAGDFTATIDWGDHGTSAGTITADGSGGFRVAGTHLYKEEGNYPIKIKIVDQGGATTSATSTAKIADAPLTAKGRTILSASTSFSGTVATFTDANPYGTSGDFTATIDWGDGSTSTGTVTASGSGFVVTGTHTYAALGPQTVRVKIDDKGGSTSSATSSILSYDYPASGDFTLGDQTVANAKSGATLTWWGSQWSTQNQVSQGSAPDAFKGYAAVPSTTPPTCGASWTSRPGDSAQPPAKVPSYLAVIVTGSVKQTGSTLSGNVVHIDVVRTDGGYDPAVGHAGTGTIVGQVC